MYFHNKEKPKKKKNLKENTEFTKKEDLFSKASKEK